MKINELARKPVFIQRAIVGSASLILSGCAVPSAGTITVSPASASAASVRSCIYSATQGGGSSVIVTGSGNACNALESGLAKDGYYWAPISMQALDSPVLSKLCALNNGDSSITVYTIGQSFFAGNVANGVCAGEEANGWIAD